MLGLRWLVSRMNVIIVCFMWFQESQRQREVVEQRYAKYKEIVGNLQHQLEESKRRIQEYRVCETFKKSHTYTYRSRKLMFTPETQLDS